MSESPPALTAKALRGILENHDTNAEIELDIPMLAEKHALQRISVEKRTHKPDRIVLVGYSD